MKKVWVVVTDSGAGKIYHAVNTNTLVEIHDFAHAEAHMREHDLVSDKPGRTTSSFGYPHNFPEKTPQKLKERNHFAVEISQFLTQAYNEKRIEALYLIAPPPFIGVLRGALNPHVAALVVMEINKDLTSFPPEKIREYLPPVL